MVALSDGQSCRFTSTSGVLATVEHSNEAGPETGKWVAETTQVCSVSPFPSRT